MARASDAEKRRKKSELLKSWLDVATLGAGDSKLARLLFDQVTDLPTVPLLFGEIKRILEEKGQLGLLYVNIVKYSSIEEIYGWKTFDDIVRHVANCLIKVKQTHLREEDILSEIMISGNAFVILASHPRTKEWVEFVDLDKVRQRIYKVLRKELQSTLDPSVYQKFGCYVGCTIMDYEPAARLERQVYRALEDALHDSNVQEASDAEARMNELKDIIRRRAIYTVYQPVVDLRTDKVIGYEALSRGPEGEFERPDKLFKVAYEADLVWRLERLCREQAFKGSRRISKDQILFLNVDPDAIHDPQFRGSDVISKVAGSSLKAERVVLELTERTAIKDFTVFRHTLDIFRGLGYKIAIDDVGAGYAALQSIAEVKPDFVKVDMSLVRDINADVMKQEVVKTIINFARRAKIKLIAEGVETAEELKTLKKLRVEIAQGFFFAYPGKAFPAVKFEFEKKQTKKKQTKKKQTKKRQTKKRTSRTS